MENIKAAKPRCYGRPKVFDFKSPKDNEIDPCDCPYANCPGCWYECKKCGSNKCSHFCRVGRKHPVEWKKSE